MFAIQGKKFMFVVAAFIVSLAIIGGVLGLPAQSDSRVDYVRVEGTVVGKGSDRVDLNLPPHKLNISVPLEFVRADAIGERTTTKVYKDPNISYYQRQNSAHGSLPATVLMAATILATVCLTL